MGNMGDTSARFDFLAAKLHGAWSRSLDGETLAALLDGGAAAFSRVLAERGCQPDHPQDMQKQASLLALEDLGAVADFLGETPAGAFYRCCMGRFFLEDLKTILHHRAQPLPNSDLDYLLVRSPRLPHLPVEALLEARTATQFCHALPPTPFQAGLKPILHDAERTKDVFVAVTRVDKLYYQTLRAAAAACPADMRAGAVTLAGMEADIFNLVLLLRNLELYHFPEDRLPDLLSSAGWRLKAHSLRHLAGAVDPGHLLRLLPALYRMVLAPLETQPLHVRENALWSLFRKQARTRFYTFRPPGTPAAAYPFLKQIELLNLCRLFEGFRFRLDPAEIRRLLVGLADV